MGKPLRDIYGEALLRYGKDNPQVVVLDADVSGSTKSGLFGAACPERYLNVGIAEANMVSMAAGLATVGMIPFANAFATFITSAGLLAARTYGSYSELPLKLVGAYSGMSDAFDGPSHHSLADIAIMRAMPNYQVFVPCDTAQVNWLVQYAIETPKPMYLRMSRDTFPDVYPEGETFECGKGKVLRDGSDVTIIACGLMVGNALEAAKQLDAEGISARVVDMFCIKPIDSELILRCAKETRAIVTAEEHNIYGGLGGAVAEVLAKAGAGVKLGMVGIPDCHGECGPYKLLQKKYGFDDTAIVRKVKELLG